MRDRLRSALPWLPWAWLAPAALACAVLATEAQLSPVPSWIATAILLVSAHELWFRTPLRRRLGERGHRLGELALGPRASAALTYLAVAGMVAVALWPVPLGHLPVGQDHAHHYLATDILVRDMLPNGRVFGWTDRISTGLPFGDVYGTGVYFLTAAVHLLSFGVVSLRTSYAFGITLAWLVPTLGVVAWSRRLSRPAPSSTGEASAEDVPGTGRLARAVGPIVAATLFAFDPGGDRQGGWIYSMFHAVWPQFFATGLWLWALLALVRLGERLTVARLGLATLAVGASIWAHPMSALSWALTAPLLLIVWTFVPADDEGAPGRSPSGRSPSSGSPSGRPSSNRSQGRAWPVLWIGVALAAGAVIGLGWFRRMLYASDQGYMVPYTTYWKPLEELVLGLLRDGLFDHELLWVTVFAVVGIGFAARRLGRLAVFTFLSLVVFAVVGSMDVLLTFDLGLHAEHKALMYNRFSITMKPLWYALAGVGVSLVVGSLGRLRAPRSAPAARLIALVAAAPVLVAFVGALPRVPLTPAGRALTAEVAEIDVELDRLTHFLRERRDDVPERQARAVEWFRGRDMGNYDLIALADADYGYFPTRKPPCQTFRYINPSTNLKAQRWMGASLLISQGPEQLDGAGDLIGTFDRLHAYDVDPERGWPVKLEGPGSFRILAWSAHERVLELSGMTEASRLVFGQTPYPKWLASIDGKRATVAHHRGVPGYRLTEVRNLRDGRLTLRYGDRPVESRALLLAAIFAALATLCLFAVGVPLPTFEHPVLDWTVRGLAALGVVAAVGFGYSEVQERREEGLADAWLPNELPGTEVLAVLHQREPLDFEYEPKSPCVRPWTRRYDMGCDEGELLPMLAPGEAVKQPLDPSRPPTEPEAQIEIPACLRFGVPDDGSTHIAFELPPGTQQVEGRLHRRGRYVANGTLRTSAGDERKVSAGGAFDLRVSPGARRVELNLSARGGTALVCLELVAFGGGQTAAKPKPAPEAKSKDETKPKPTPEAKPNGAAEPKADARPSAEPKRKPDAKPNVEAKTRPQIRETAAENER